MHSAAVVLFDHCHASSVAAVTDVFRVANQLWLGEHRDAQPLFSWKLVSRDGKPVTASSGMRIDADGALPRTGTDIVFVPAFHYESDDDLLRGVDGVSRDLRAWLLRQHRDGAWMTAGCSGAFVLAATGLLDGHRATTSWWIAELFRRRHPQVLLERDAIVAEDGPFLTAGPVNAHFNLALRLVETLGGRALALLCARVLLVDANRGSQLPYVLVQAEAGHTDDLVLRAQEWMRRRVKQDIGIDAVARAVGASTRTLIRRFKKAQGTTPLKYLQEVRIETAKQLLQTTALPLEALIERVGYSDPGAFRKLFREHTSLTPAEYRRRFAMPRMH
jgi:transcriptional regulator GlxA family with amidase domain